MSEHLKPLSSEAVLDILSLSKDAIALYVGKNKVIQFASDAMIALWRKDRTIIGKPLTDAIPELIGHTFLDKLDNLWNTGETYNAKDVCIEQIIDGDVDQRLFDVEYIAIRDNQGDICAILHTAADVTIRSQNIKLLLDKDEREQDLIDQLTEANDDLVTLAGELKLMNEQLIASGSVSQSINSQLSATVHSLVESEGRFRLMADGTDVMIAIGDPTGSITYLNKAWTKATGKPNEELLKFGWIQLVHIEDRSKLELTLQTFKKNHVPWEVEIRLLVGENTYRWFLSRGRPRFSANGIFIGYIGSTIDITDRKAQEQRKSDFIGIVSHELRSPLTLVNGYFQVLGVKAKRNGDNSMVDLSEKGIRQVTRMTNIVSGFLDVAKLGQSEIQLNKSHFNMGDLIKSAESESLATITTHQVVYHPVEYTPVNADWDKVEQVVINFVNNAVKYSPGGKVIHVSCITRDGLAHVSVTDEGFGIPGKDLPHIFERYYRVDAAETKTVTGFGIGLYISKEIIDAHAGHIGVESIEGKGSTFWFDLPAIGID